MKHFIRITAVALLFVSAASMSVPNVSAQETTPTPQSESASENGGFFSDFRIGDGISIVSIVGVGILGIWLFRIQGARMQLLNQSVQSAKDELEDERKRSRQEIENERRHTERLREQHQAAEELLRHQLEDAERRAGIDPSGQVSATRVELSEEDKQGLSEVVALLKEMRAARLEEQPPVAPSAEVLAQEHLRQGNAYYAAADYERAVHEYTRALELRPDNATLLHNRGVALTRLNRDEEALHAFDRALQLRPDDPDTIMSRGVPLRKLGRHEEALAAYDRALQLRPDDPTTLMNRGVPLGYQGRYEEALADYDRALQLLPDDPGTLYNRACLYSLWNKPAEALEDLRRAIAADPKYHEQARTDADFDNIRDDPRFRELVGEDEPPVEGGSNS